MVSPPCKVCAAPAAKYRCPTCRIPFCSVSCSKAHKQTPCTAPRPATPQPPPPPRVIPGRARPALPEHLQERPATLMDAQRGALRACAAVAAAARDLALQAVLKRVDAAPDREAALAAEMTDPRFVEFADLLLDTVGAGIGVTERRAEERREAARAELERLLHG